MNKLKKQMHNKLRKLRSAQLTKGTQEEIMGLLVKKTSGLKNLFISKLEVQELQTIN